MHDDRPSPFPRQPEPRYGQWPDQRHGLRHDQWHDRPRHDQPYLPPQGQPRDEQPSNAGRTPPRFLVSEITLGLLILVMTVVTAWAAYQGELASDDEGDSQVLGQSKLSEAGTLALTSAQLLAQDASAIDNYFIHENDPELSQYFQEKLSEELTASVNLETGEVDEEAYLDAVLKDAADAAEASEKAFAEAEDVGGAVNSYSLVVLVFALGVAMAGLGSLRKDGTWLRAMFTIAAITTLVFGSVVMAGVGYVALRL